MPKLFSFVFAEFRRVTYRTVSHIRLQVRETVKKLNWIS